MICNHYVAFPCYSFDRSRSKSMNQFFLLNINYELWFCSVWFTRPRINAIAYRLYGRRYRLYGIERSGTIPPDPGGNPFSYLIRSWWSGHWTRLRPSAGFIWTTHCISLNWYFKLGSIFAISLSIFYFVWTFVYDWNKVDGHLIDAYCLNDIFTLLVELMFWFIMDHNLWLNHNVPRFMGPRKFGRMIQTRMDILMRRKFMPISTLLLTR